MAIIASDPVIRKELRSLISKCDPECRVMEEAGSIADARPLLANFSPDALLLDADLSDGSGFDLLDLVPLCSHQVIMMASNKDAMSRAVGYNVADVILKPIEQASLWLALGKLHQNGSSDNLSPPTPTLGASGASDELDEPLLEPAKNQLRPFDHFANSLPNDDLRQLCFNDNGVRMIFSLFPW